MRKSYRSVISINKNTLEKKEYQTQYFAKVDGFNSCKIGECCRTKYLTHRGYFWFYKDEFSEELLNNAIDLNKKPRRSPTILEFKICSKCKTNKPISEFHKANKTQRADCKICNIKRSIEYVGKNKEKTKKRLKEYGKNYKRNRRKTDVQFKLSELIRGRIFSALNGKRKPDRILKNIGCTLLELKTYLEKQFQPGMTWINHGKWHIDHIYPLAKLDLTDKHQFLKAIHYTNLQPLWAADNIRKGAKIASTKL